MDTVHLRPSPRTVSLLVRSQFPRYRDAPVTPVAPTGTVNAIFRIGEVASARFRLRPDDLTTLTAALHRESAAMAELADALSLPSPRPLGIGGPGPGYPLAWSIQTWLPGEVATPDGLAGADAFAGDLAALVGELRSVDVRGRVFDGVGRGGGLREHDAWMEECFARSAGMLDVPRLRELWLRLRDLPRSGPDVMSHRDLIPANLLVRGGRLAGVLDGGGFGPADPALDLVAAWHLLDGPRRALFRARVGGGVGDTEWWRGAAWAFVQAMGLPWYYRESNPGMAALGRGTLRRVVSEAEAAGVISRRSSRSPSPDSAARPGTR